MKTIETNHQLFIGDARDMSFIDDSSIHLVVTSPPYWNLKEYNEHRDQLGRIDDYDIFLRELSKSLAEIYRILKPGGRFVCVIGDVCVAKKKFGRHLVFPLHSDVCVECRKIGFDNLNPIIWYKITNSSFGDPTKPVMMGNPYMPNSIIKNDIEYILIQRKIGKYRKTDDEIKALSKFSKDDYRKCFRQIWQIPGTSSKDHPAPFPLEIPTRLIKMFSYVGDIVLDPFCGTGTTSIAAINNQRSSIGIEIDKTYYQIAANNIRHYSACKTKTEHFEMKFKEQLDE